jgi:D-alanyl-D-alanine carboxypeptidase
VLALAVFGTVIAASLALAGTQGGSGPDGPVPVQQGAATPKPLLDRAAGAERAVAQAEGSDRFAVDLSQPDVVEKTFERRPRAGLLFDLRTGRVLWRLDPERTLPIASLTKLMTALLVVEQEDAHDRVLITRRATRTPGSAVGVLPRGKKVQLEALMNGLLLVSGNDAAVALAQHTAGTVRDFVATMNRRATEMGLGCTHFTTPHGLEDRGNHSCAADLAALARADMSESRIRRIVRRDEAILKFPIKGGRLFLYNHNPLVRMHYRGVTGLKTGYTDRAGRSMVATATRGKKRLGVVLLHSYNPAAQAKSLLDRGFKTPG